MMHAPDRPPSPRVRGRCDSSRDIARVDRPRHPSDGLVAYKVSLDQVPRSSNPRPEATRESFGARERVLRLASSVEDTVVAIERLITLHNECTPRVPISLERSAESVASESTRVLGPFRGSVSARTEARYVLTARESTGWRRRGAIELDVVGREDECSVTARGHAGDERAGRWRARSWGSTALAVAFALGAYAWLNGVYGAIIAFVATALFGPYVAMLVFVAYDELASRFARRRRGPDCLGVSPQRVVWTMIERLDPATRPVLIEPLPPALPPIPLDPNGSLPPEWLEPD